MDRVSNIRQSIIDKYLDEDFVVDRTGAKTIELIGTTFLADEEYIIRKPSEEYIQRELDWYISQSLNVNDIPGETPQIWKSIASDTGEINSNYGWCIFSKENGDQYGNVFRELVRNPNSRRAAMIYNRPTMHTDMTHNGMNDFMCTYANTFYIRDDKLISHFVMRSNDAVFGFNNDVAWALYVQNLLAADLALEVGDLIWTASNFHVYERHFNFIEKLIDEMG